VVSHCFGSCVAGCVVAYLYVSFAFAIVALRAAWLQVV
jgi:(2Fe-2S) ferredoxin